MCDFDGEKANYERNDGYNIHVHWKLQVNQTNIFGLGAKTNIARWQQPPTNNFDSY